MVRCAFGSSRKQCRTNCFPCEYCEVPSTHRLVHQCHPSFWLCGLRTWALFRKYRNLPGDQDILAPMLNTSAWLETDGNLVLIRIVQCNGMTRQYIRLTVNQGISIVWFIIVRLYGNGGDLRPRAEAIVRSLAARRSFILSTWLLVALAGMAFVPEPLINVMLDGISWRLAATSKSVGIPALL